MGCPHVLTLPLLEGRAVCKFRSENRGLVARRLTGRSEETVVSLRACGYECTRSGPTLRPVRGPWVGCGIVLSCLVPNPPLLHSLTCKDKTSPSRRNFSDNFSMSTNWSRRGTRSNPPSIPSSPFSVRFISSVGRRRVDVTSRSLESPTHLCSRTYMYCPKCHGDTFYSYHSPCK